MTDTLRQMTTLESFDARVNTDNLTIQGDWKNVTALEAPKRPDGACIYRPNGNGGVVFESLEEPQSTMDIRL